MQMRWKKIGIGVAVCLAIGIVTMSRSAGRDAPEHTPGNAEIQEHTTAHQQPVQAQTSHMYDSAFFVSLIQDTCEQVLPLTNLSVEIQEDGVLAVSGLLQKEQAKKLLEQQTVLCGCVTDAAASAAGILQAPNTGTGWNGGVDDAAAFRSIYGIAQCMDADRHDRAIGTSVSCRARQNVFFHFFD